MRHQQLTDELQERASLYAAGALDEREREEFSRHLEEDDCAVCRAEVLESETAAQSLAIMLPMQTPSDSVKRRLLARAEAASFSARRRSSEERTRPVIAWSGWLAAAAALLLVAFFFNQNSRLREDMASLTSSRVVNLAGQGTTPQASARIFWNEADRQWRVFVEDLPPVPSDRAYQLWFVPPAGADPVSARVFNTSADGSAEFEIPVPAGITTLMAAAVTVEPSGGSPQPTSGGFALLGAIP